jgi:SAM-dependent methyltransferase
MADRGWKVIGMDFSEHAAAQVRERFKLPVYVGSLPHPAVRPESFDVINMGASLEHVPHPNRVLEAAVKALRPGGLLVASVPNFAGWVPRTFGTDWFSLDLPRHLQHFTPATLRRLLVAHGLVVEELRMLGRVSWLRRTLRNARTSGNAPWKRRLAALAPGLWTRWTVWSRQADCMMAIARKPASETLRMSA